MKAVFVRMQCYVNVCNISLEFHSSIPLFRCCFDCWWMRDCQQWWKKCWIFSLIKHANFLTLIRTCISFLSLLPNGDKRWNVTFQPIGNWPPSHVTINIIKFKFFIRIIGTKSHVHSVLKFCYFELMHKINLSRFPQIQLLLWLSISSHLVGTAHVSRHLLKLRVDGNDGNLDGKLYPDSNVHGANMGPTWVLSAPDGPRVGPMNQGSCPRRDFLSNVPIWK